MITETNTKQTAKSTDIIKSKFKDLGRSLELIVAESKTYNITESNWLQGRLLNVSCRKIPTLLQKNNMKINNLGRWIEFILTNREKKILVIKIC